MRDFKLPTVPATSVSQHAVRARGEARRYGLLRIRLELQINSILFLADLPGVGRPIGAHKHVMRSNIWPTHPQNKFSIPPPPLASHNQSNPYRPLYSSSLSQPIKQLDKAELHNIRWTLLSRCSISLMLSPSRFLIWRSWWTPSKSLWALALSRDLY
jgi:hypothetical protein